MENNFSTSQNQGKMEFIHLSFHDLLQFLLSKAEKENESEVDKTLRNLRSNLIARCKSHMQFFPRDLPAYITKGKEKEESSFDEEQFSRKEIIKLHSDIYSRLMELENKTKLTVQIRAIQREKRAIEMVQEECENLKNVTDIELIELIKQKIVLCRQFVEEEPGEEKDKSREEIYDIEMKIVDRRSVLKDEKEKGKFPRCLEKDFENILSLFGNMETAFPCPDFYRLKLKLEIARTLQFAPSNQSDRPFRSRTIFGGFPRDLIILANEMKKFAVEYPDEDFWNPTIGDYSTRTILPKDIDVQYTLGDYVKFDHTKFPVSQNEKRDFPGEASSEGTANFTSQKDEVRNYGYTVHPRESVNTFNFNYPNWGINISRIRAVMCNWELYTNEEIYCDIDCITNNQFYRKFKPDMESNILGIKNGKLILFHVPDYGKEHQRVEKQLHRKYEAELNEAREIDSKITDKFMEDHPDDDIQFETKNTDAVWKKFKEEHKNTCRHCKLSIGNIINDICQKKTYVVSYCHARENQKFDENQIKGRKIRVRRVVKMLMKGWKLENLKDVELTYVKVSLDDPSKTYRKEKSVLYLPHCNHYMNEEYFYEFCEKQLETSYHVKCCDEHETDIV